MVARKIITNLIFVLVLGCSQKEDSCVECLPEQIGKEWVYQQGTRARDDGSIIGKIDKIVRREAIDGINCFVVETTYIAENSEEVYEYYYVNLEDGLYLVGDDQIGIFYPEGVFYEDKIPVSIHETPILIWKYPFEIGSEWESRLSVSYFDSLGNVQISYTDISKKYIDQQEIETEAGKFQCIVAEHRIGETIYESYIDYQGIIKNISYYGGTKNNPSESYRLIDFN